MRCHEVLKLLSPYLDSELDPTTTFQVGQHLEACPTCACRFEREGRADGLIAERLKRGEAVLDWGTLENVVWTAPRRRIRRPAWLLAAAAAVAFLAIGLGSWPRATRAGAVQWAADEMYRLSPAGAAFPESQTCQAQDYKDICTAVLRQDVELNLDALKPHHTELMAASRKMCQGGRGGVQLLLNCCDQPILVAMGLADTPGEFRDVAERFNGDAAVDVSCKGRSYHVAVRRLGQMILVGVSCSAHQADHVLECITSRPI